MKKFKQLQSGEIEWSTTVREWLREHEKPDECIYCGKKGDLTTEHILPTSRGGPDTTDNVIRVCKSCNSSKGSERLYEWYTEENRDKIPRIAEGKYLKLLYEIHKKNNSLDNEKMCEDCDLGEKCKEEQSREQTHRLLPRRSFQEMDMMIAGMIKRRLDKMKTIVEKLLKKEKLTEEDKEFLKKEKIDVS
jgi:hypothetical protein